MVSLATTHDLTPLVRKRQADPNEGTWGHTTDQYSPKAPRSQDKVTEELTLQQAEEKPLSAA